MILVALLLITLVLAAANGANDNIKGAATLMGSGLADYRHAIAWATAATALGGVLSIVVANGLLQAFGGRGILPDDIAGTPGFLMAVGLGAGATVWLATRSGLPVSTTHGLLGGLLGAGLAAAPQDVAYATALRTMLGPLLVSPVAAIALALLLVPALRRWRARNDRNDGACLCATVPDTVPASMSGNRAAGAAFVPAPPAPFHLGHRQDAACRPPAVEIAGLASNRLLDRAHFLSAMAVSFARGLNDTPKIAALLVVAGGLGVAPATLAVVLAIAAGGLLAARRVADTLAWRITRMDPAEGLGGNLVAAALVFAASRFGLPVSTTHVTTGALFGIAAGNRSGRADTIVRILLAWLLTLPLAATLSALAHAGLSRL